MPVPKTIFKKLSVLRIGQHEWATIMIILHKTYGEERRIAKLSIENFVEHTNIKPPHVIRALHNLEEKNIIKRHKIDRLITEYWLQQDPSKWRSDLTIQLPNEVIKEHEDSFKEWIERYPGPLIGLEDARIMYLNILANGNKASDIDDSLTGYGNLKKAFALTTNKPLTKFNYMYPVNFLRKWQDFLAYKDGKAIARLLDPEKYVGGRK